jgi:hypothetical protein
MKHEDPGQYVFVNFECFKCIKHDSRISNNEDEQEILAMCNEHSFLQLP